MKNKCLDHSEIIKLKYFDEKIFSINFEYFEEKTLKEYVSSKHHLDVEESLRFLSELVNLTKYLHE
jgi:hypothetical protein